MDNTFETAFSNFFERVEYDEAAGALFSVVRAAFTAGWKAAGGILPVPQQLYVLPLSDERPPQE